MKRITKRQKRLLECGLFCFTLVVSLIFFILITMEAIFPLKYLFILFGLLSVNLGVIFYLIFINRKKVLKYLGYVFSFISFIVIIIGGIYFSATTSFLSSFGGGEKYSSYEFILLVNNESDFNEINDLVDLKIGYVFSELGYIEEAIIELENEISYDEVLYEDYDDAFIDLSDINIDGVFIDGSYYELFLMENPDYATMFRIVYTVSIEKLIEIATEVDVTKDTFAMYISGGDNYGNLYNVSLSDVNMVVVVNPSIKEILLISIPRDYYVQLSGTTGYKDKLTHATMYGIDTAVSTVSDLLGFDINYYAKVNFSTLEKIVEGVGGIDVYSEYTFVSGEATGGTYQFYNGYNHMNGNQALSFCRERTVLPGGDRARGINQQAVIDGLVRKIASPSILSKYTSLLNSLTGTFSTNMTDEEMKSLIKMQLDDMASWKITSHSLDGTDGGLQYTYSYPKQGLYVMEPNMETVYEATNLYSTLSSGIGLSGSYDSSASNVKDATLVVPEVEDEEEIIIPEGINFIYNSASELYVTGLTDISLLTLFDGKTNLFSMLNSSGELVSGNTYITAKGAIGLAIELDNVCYVKEFSDSTISILKEYSNCSIILLDDEIVNDEEFNEDSDVDLEEPDNEVDKEESFDNLDELLPEDLTSDESDSLIEDLTISENLEN